MCSAATLGVILHSRRVGAEGVRLPGLLVTPLLPQSPKLLLNVEMGRGHDVCGTDVLRILEEILPARFGGRPTSSWPRSRRTVACAP
jgi:hypothetical protein